MFAIFIIFVQQLLGSYVHLVHRHFMAIHSRPLTLNPKFHTYGGTQVKLSRLPESLGYIAYEGLIHPLVPKNDSQAFQWQSIKYLLRYFSLNQSGGPKHQLTNRLFPHKPSLKV